MSSGQILERNYVDGYVAFDSNCTKRLGLVE